MKKILLGLLLTFELLTAEGTLMIEVAYNQDGYTLNRVWKIVQTYPPTLQTTTKHQSDIIIEIKDKHSNIIDIIRIENPNIIRGILSENNSQEGHHSITNNKGTFIIRYPYSKKLNALHIQAVKEKTNKRMNTGTSSTYKQRIKPRKSHDLYFKHLLLKSNHSFIDNKQDIQEQFVQPILEKEK